ncbi:hypothetical protein [Mailhella massiliensis]|uniref:hypothetical protein n=1 Tax=Mailhella massiliensis TaxID=1903261 RepID=UPI00097CFA27|nr:hypothetical protein [Mailhella massiliensis]
MPENVHIPLGKVQAAYGLTDDELYDLIQKLWERKQLFYKELWAETYEKYWHFAATGSLPSTQEKLSELPEPDSRHQSNFYPIFYGTQMVRYLMQLIKLVSYKPFRLGLDYLFDTAFEDGHSVAAEERDILYKYFEFTELDRKPPRKDYYRHFKAGQPYLVSFISRNMTGTLMADRDAVIEFLGDYPLKREVKGLTHRVVNSILDRLVTSAANIQLEIQPEIPVEASVSSLPSAENIVVPSSLWMGKAPASVRDAMKEDFDECVTAHVLLNWCKLGKTQVGRLLSPKEFGDDKSYRNHVDKLLLRAARLSIRQE